MAKIRVYEAAKKLNIDTKELMAILNARGVSVKSPISFIARSDIDEILESLVASREGDDDAREVDKVVSFPGGKSSAKADDWRAAETARVDKKKLTVVRLQQEDAAGKTAGDDAASPVEEGADAPPPPEDAAGMLAEAAPVAESTTPEKKKQAPVKEPAEAEEKAPEPAAQSGPSPIQSIFSYIALGVAVAALLAVFVLQSNVSENSDGMTQALQVTEALQGDMSAAQKGIIANQGLIGESRAAIGENRAALERLSDMINDTRRVQARAGLAAQASALEEMAPALSKEMAGKVMSISRGLNALASSL